MSGSKRQDVYGQFDRDTGAVVALRTLDPAAPFQPLPTTAQVQALGGLAFTGMTYDGGGRLTGYVRNGVAHVVTWTDATHCTIGNGTGAPDRIVTLDGVGRALSLL